MGTNNVKYDFKALNKSSQIYRQKFDQLYVFGKMDYESRKGCKIGNNGGLIHIYFNNTLQSVQRWWYKESREELCNYLASEFTDYIKFLSNINNIFQQNPYQKNLKDLYENEIKFIECILPGLEKCKYIYSDFKMLDFRIDNIIASLNKYIESKSRKNIQFMSQSISQILPKSTFTTK